MQDLVVSMIRFSTAITLYGLEQIRAAVEMTINNEDESNASEKLESTLESMTEVLLEKIDEGKKETLKSVTSVAQEVVSKAFDGMSMLDPREALKATNDILKKSSDAVSDWFGKEEEVDDESQPQAAADVLK